MTEIATKTTPMTPIHKAWETRHRRMLEAGWIPKTRVKKPVPEASEGLSPAQKAWLTRRAKQQQGGIGECPLEKPVSRMQGPPVARLPLRIEVAENARRQIACMSSQELIEAYFASGGVVRRVPMGARSLPAIGYGIREILRLVGG